MDEQQRQSNQEQSPQHAVPSVMGEQGVILERFYRDLIDLVRICANAGIDKDRIERAVRALADVFVKDPYNGLLLCFYSNSKENYIYAHIANNVILSIGFAVSMRLPLQDVVDVGLCAFGHDFGMLEFRDLFQKPTQLSVQENQSLQNHPEKSAGLFRAHFSQRVIDGILDVHEAVNGKGYPKGKTDGEISYLAKVVAICDIFEALTHVRSFRSEFSPFAAIKMIIKKKDLMFDRKLIKRFVEFVSIYPVGSLVRLNTGETGMVIAANQSAPTRSVVRVLLNPQREVILSGRTIDLLSDPMLYISGTLEPKEEREILHFLKPRGEVQI